MWLVGVAPLLSLLKRTKIHPKQSMGQVIAWQHPLSGDMLRPLLGDTTDITSPGHMHQLKLQKRTKTSSIRFIMRIAWQATMIASICNTSTEQRKASAYVHWIHVSGSAQMPIVHGSAIKKTATISSSPIPWSKAASVFTPKNKFGNGSHVIRNQNWYLQASWLLLRGSKLRHVAVYRERQPLPPIFFFPSAPLI